MKTNDTQPLTPIVEAPFAWTWSSQVQLVNRIPSSDSPTLKSLPSTTKDNAINSVSSLTLHAIDQESSPIKVPPISSQSKTLYQEFSAQSIKSAKTLECYRFWSHKRNKSKKYWTTILICMLSFKQRNPSRSLLRSRTTPRGRS